MCWRDSSGLSGKDGGGLRGRPLELKALTVRIDKALLFLELQSAGSRMEATCPHGCAESILHLGLDSVKGVHSFACKTTPRAPEPACFGI